MSSGTLCQWCHQRGMSFREYNDLNEEVDREATALVATASALRKTGTGMYFPVEELIPTDVRERYEARELLAYLLAALLVCGVEFYGSRSLYRI